MLRIWLVPCLIIPFVFVMLTSCSDSKPEAPTDRNAHPRFWVNPSATGNHGVTANLEGNESCATCHGADLNGSGVIPGCYDCHFDQFGSRVPQGSNWLHASFPHDQLLVLGETCNNCHLINRKFGFQPDDTCHDCHVRANHPVGQPWLDKISSEFHGIDALADLDQCTRCHGDDFLGGIADVSCSQCHFGPAGDRVPEGELWTHGTTPHSELAAYVDVCNQCHDVNRGFGNDPTACHDCHGSGILHELGSAWLLPGNHAQESIADRATCLACHDLDTGGSGTDPACQSCHDKSNPPLSIGLCSSCHSSSPSTGDHGEHTEVSCTTCHDGFGNGSLEHYYPDPTPPADVKFNFSNSGDNLIYNGTSCSGSCHMGSSEKVHDSFNW